MLLCKVRLNSSAVYDEVVMFRGDAAGVREETIAAGVMQGRGGSPMNQHGGVNMQEILGRGGSRWTLPKV